MIFSNAINTNVEIATRKNTNIAQMLHTYLSDEGKTFYYLQEINTNTNEKFGGQIYYRLPKKVRTFFN